MMKSDNPVRDNDSQVTIGKSGMCGHSSDTIDIVNQVTAFTDIPPKDILFSTLDKRYDPDCLMDTILETIQEATDIGYACFAIRKRDPLYKKYCDIGNKPFGFVLGNMDYDGKRPESVAYGLSFDIMENQLWQGAAGDGGDCFVISCTEHEREITFIPNAIYCEFYDYDPVRKRMINSLDLGPFESKYFDYDQIDIVIYTVDENTVPRPGYTW